MSDVLSNTSSQLNAHRHSRDHSTGNALWIFRLHGYLRTDWIDERINVNSSLVNNRCIDYLWIPDVIFGAFQGHPDLRKSEFLFFHRHR
ncbi:hypothetical protein CEXT_60421 [Caerostris extrusa]|uniref:Uncharacterized protein n=1 Tax=Caerostris extrusa TaxID=172846 RepID=A0AAV4W2Y9_CAEEX|nr:hypothetical protein CEXT_60421 [Caerostris extrusa]